MAYELFYWRTIQGRGEFVRLALEEAGAAYVDVARERGTDEMLSILGDAGEPHIPFAPPFLRHGRRLMGQTVLILQYLGDRHALAPKAEAGRLWTHQLQLTIADLVSEAHETHHPISAELYYEDQKREAALRAKHFRETRIPKFLDWFEEVLARNPRGRSYLVGGRITYADLSLFQAVEGLTYAFPLAMKRMRAPRVRELQQAVARRPRISAYLASERRIPFNVEGIFRHYPELDA